MRTSKIQELVDINAQYHKKTTEYVEKNHNFIEEFIKKLAASLNVNVDRELALINSAGQTIYKGDTIGDFITIKNDCFFEFCLRLKMPNPISPMIVHPYSQSFFENNLAPLSEIIFVIAIKQQENSFIVRVPAIEKEVVVHKQFVITDQNDNNLWTEIFNSCFEAMKKTVEDGLEKRISKLNIPTDDTSKKIIGLCKYSDLLKGMQKLYE